MTVNKVQGQSLDVVGIDLHEPASTHGQLYIVLSHTTSPAGLMVLRVAECQLSTLTVLYPEVLIQGWLYFCLIEFTLLLYIIYNLQSFI